MGFFNGYCERLGPAQAEVVRPLAAWLASEQAATLHVPRKEGAFLDGGSVLVTMRGAQVIEPVSWEYVLPVVRMIAGLDAACLRGRSPFRVEFSTLRPGGTVAEHHDRYVFQALCERVHVPLRTDGTPVFESSSFADPGQWHRFGMEVGSVYRLNNRVPHRVNNLMQDARTHLILDYLDDQDLAAFRASKLQLTGIAPITSQEYRGVH
jgi:Aspartyl/Asparaginyl beta-hydroxylase